MEIGMSWLGGYTVMVVIGGGTVLNKETCYIKWVTTSWTNSTMDQGKDGKEGGEKILPFNFFSTI